MEQTKKLCDAIGLSMKAGKLQSGDFVVEKLVRAGRVKLVLLDAETAKNTRQKYERLCEGTRVEWLDVPQLGRCIGKPGRMVAAVSDMNFCNMIRAAAQYVASERQE